MGEGHARGGGYAPFPGASSEYLVEGGHAIEKCVVKNNWSGRGGGGNNSIKEFYRS